MTYRDILVALDSAPATRGRVELAAALAQRFDAHLVGLHTAIAADLSPRRDHPGRFEHWLLDPLYRDFLANQQRGATAARALFEAATARQAVSAEWRQAVGYPSDTTALHGRYVDLIVLGQLDPDDPAAALFRPLPEEVALAVGRPLLVVPYAGDVATVGQRVLIGWDASREATRAVNDAMPFLNDARSVTVLAIDPAGGPAGHGDMPGADIGLHLARHGVKAAIETTVSSGVAVGDVLLSRAGDLAADLLVMGAYAHSRLRQLILGGATRTVLNTMTLPVLLAH